MNIEIPDQVTRLIEAVLFEQQCSPAKVAHSINRIVERVAEDEQLLRTLLSDSEFGSNAEQAPPEPP